MAVKRSQNWINQLRVDVPMIRSIESAVRADFDDLIGSFAIGTGASYVIRGFEINMTSAIGVSASALQMIVANSSLFHGKSSQAGTFFQIPTGTPNQTINATTNTTVQGSFTPNTLNYVGIEFARAVDSTTSAQVFLWNPTNKNEISKTVPLAETLSYKIVVTSSIWAANVLPISIIETDASNNVLSVEDRRPMLFRLGTGGPNTPNPFNEYAWTNHAEGRTENFWKSTSSTSPFRGGDKQLLHFKEWADAVMSSLLEVKGTAYWYSPNAGGSLVKLRGDLALLQLTGNGLFSHHTTNSGQLNWSSDLFLKYIGSRLEYKINSNIATTHLTLTDNQVAYINIVRGVDVIPNLIFTQSSAVVNSVGAVSWTSNVLAGDFLKVGAEDDTKYYEISTVDSVTQVTLTEVFLEASTGAGGVQAKYAYGTYQTDAAPSTNRHIQIAARRSVPFNEDVYWLFFRSDDGGATPKIYIRGSQGELEKGEERSISDNQSEDILTFIGATSETDNAPAYSSEEYVTDGDPLTTAISKLDLGLKSHSGIKTIGGGTISWDIGTTALGFTAPMYLEIRGLAYTDNNLPITESPIVLPNSLDVAYVVPNVDAGGPNLVITVGALNTVPNNAVIVARRENTDVIVGTSSTRLKDGQSAELYAQMSDENINFIGLINTADNQPVYTSDIRGTGGESLFNRISILSDAMGDAQEDRSAYLRSDDPVTWTGAQLQFTADIVLEIINTKTGTLKAATILLAGSPIILADNESAWVLIDRSAASENLTVNLSGVTPIPAQTQADKDVIVIARRKDANGAGYVHIPLHKQVLEPGQTTRLGASGSGSGGGNEILETLKNHFIDATFDLLTPNIFKTDKSTKVDGASTGAYSLVSTDFEFSAAAQTLVSIQMADAIESLANTNALTQVELLAFWNPSFIDTAAVYEVSRNGGNAWQTAVMSRVGSTELYRAVHTFTDEVTNQTMFSQLTSDANRDLNTTTQQETSQPFTIAAGSKRLLKDVVVAFTKTGSPTGNLFVSLYTDLAGNPDVVIAESNAILVSSLVTGDNTIDLPDTYLAAGTYHIKFRTDATYKGVYSVGVTSLALQANSAGSVPYARQYDGTVWSVSATDNLVYTIRGITIDLRVRITSSAGSMKLSGYGILYDKSVGNIATGIINREVFNFSGTSNLNEFTITKFVPNADLLKVYDVVTGQVYTFGAWSLQGQKVVFEVGKFNSPGNALTLVFDQTIGGAFDNSDRNGLLLANNFLGSTDTGIDKSVNGRGIFLRRPDGTLREIAIDNSDNIIIYSI